MLVLCQVSPPPTRTLSGTTTCEPSMSAGTLEATDDGHLEVLVLELVAAAPHGLLGGAGVAQRLLGGEERTALRVALQDALQLHALELLPVVHAGARRVHVLHAAAAHAAAAAAAGVPRLELLDQRLAPVLHRRRHRLHRRAQVLDVVVRLAVGRLGRLERRHRLVGVRVHHVVGRLGGGGQTGQRHGLHLLLKRVDVRLERVHRRALVLELRALVAQLAHVGGQLGRRRGRHALLVRHERGVLLLGGASLGPRGAEAQAASRGGCGSQGRRGV
mmetsp:Transcript_25826/g.63552  ORF Transcript_25826/g.63552 Transcript_25826/m.63552 type:complete len:274 (-) Transcript_25826:15-836(-)